MRGPPFRLPRPSCERELHMIEINDEYMTLTIEDKSSLQIVQPVWAGDGNAAWIVGFIDGSQCLLPLPADHCR
jgi:hypothetical protein